MKKEENNLDRLKGTNPFIVPEGYMEGLTDRIMSQLPDKPKEEAKTVTFMDHIRPWLYLAAVFVGLGLFFKAIIGDVVPGEDGMPDSLLVRTEVPMHGGDITAETDEDEEYLEYLEEKCTDLLMDEDLEEIE